MTPLQKVACPCKADEESVQIVGGSGSADKKEDSEGLRNCQDSSKPAASSHVKTPLGGGKCSGL